MTQVPPAKFVAQIGAAEHVADVFKKFTSNDIEGNFYIDAVMFGHCPTSETQLKDNGDECSSVSPWSSQSVNLLKASRADIDLTVGNAILNPILMVRHSGGNKLGTIRKAHTVHYGLTIPDAIRIDVVVAGSTFTITEGFGIDGRNEIHSDTNIPSGKAFSENNMATSFFGVGWGDSHFINNFNTSKSDPTTGLYAYDFHVAENPNGDKLFFRTYLKVLQDDLSPIVIPSRATTGHPCCR
jgi:hypothetical protein